MAVIGLCIGCGHPFRVREKTYPLPFHPDPHSSLVDTRCPGSNRLPLLWWDTEVRTINIQKKDMLPPEDGKD